MSNESDSCHASSNRNTSLLQRNNVGNLLSLDCIPTVSHSSSSMSSLPHLVLLCTCRGRAKGRDRFYKSNDDWCMKIDSEVPSNKLVHECIKPLSSSSNILVTTNSLTYSMGVSTHLVRSSDHMEWFRIRKAVSVSPLFPQSTYEYAVSASSAKCIVAHPSHFKNILCEYDTKRYSTITWDGYSHDLCKCWTQNHSDQNIYGNKNDVSDIEVNMIPDSLLPRMSAMSAMPATPKSDSLSYTSDASSTESVSCLLHEKEKELQRKSEEHIADVSYMKALMDEMYVEGMKLRKELQKMKLDNTLLQDELNTLKCYDKSLERIPNEYEDLKIENSLSNEKNLNCLSFLMRTKNDRLERRVVCLEAEVQYWKNLYLRNV